MAPRLYIATNGLSVWYSDNLGEELQRTQTARGMYSGTQVWGLACHPANTGEVLCGTELGLFCFRPSDDKWSRIPSAMDQKRLVTAVAYSPHDPRVVLAGTQTANLYRSEDGGHSWTDLKVPMHPSVALEFLGGADANNNPRVRVERGKADDPIQHWTRVCQITFDPDDPNLVCACVEIDDAWVSHDGGRTFNRQNAGLDGAAADVHGMAIVRNGKRKLFATTAFGLHTSDDDGQHWTFNKLASPWQYTRSIVERPDRVGVMYLTNGSGSPGWQGRLYRSRDYGESWQDVGLPGAVQSSVYFLAVNRADPMLGFAAGSLGQLYRTTDGGETWIELPRRLGEIRAIAWAHAG
jgi:photosystem II stability/assembly factor-like uncharacterized protein